MKKISEKLAELCAGMLFDSFSEVDVFSAKLHFLDYLGVTARGNTTEPAKVAAALAISKPAGVRSPIIGTKKSANYDWAAFVNGTANHSIEFDDTYFPGIIHIGASVFSACLAEACNTNREVSGKDFIEAIITGYEISGRTGASHNKFAFERGFHPTGTCNVFGAAMASARIKKMDIGKMVRTFGIAGHFACGLNSFLAEGAWTKRIHPGMAAFNGLQASALADLGFVSETGIFEDQSGFLRAYASNYSEEALFPQKPVNVISNTSFKPYPCCARIHASIKATLDLITENKIYTEYSLHLG